MTIGRKDGDPDLIMSGLSIQKLHAVLSHNGGEVTLKPGTPGAKTKVNGLPLTGERVLKHLDRVLLGSNHWYYFFNPLNKEKSEGTPDTVDWDFAQKEIAQSKGFQTGLGSGLSKEQVEAQEQVLELLPMVSEVNAISEELDKHKSFEVILISGAIQDANHGKGTKVMVKMKNMLNDNTWLWDRGRFMNRRFIMADIYQRFLDGEDVSKMPKEEDPFWEPPEDVLVGTANVFLQSLSYALDFDDKLAITDYKGSEEGSIIVNVTPCTSSGKILDEDYFVDDPKDLLGKPYHFKVQIRSSEVQKAKYSSGLYVKYKTLGDTEWTETPVVERTTSPEFNHSKLFSFPAITEEHLEWFDSGCIAFHVYAKQVDSVADARLLKMTTKELRQMEHIQKPTVTHRGSVYQPNPNAESAQVKSELILLKRKYDRLAKKEKRIQDLVTEWGQKPAEEKSFDSFYRAMHAAAFYQRGQLKYKVNMLQSLKTYYLPGENEDSELSLLEDGSEESCYLKNQPDTTANGGTIKTEVKGGQGGSKACSVM